MLSACCVIFLPSSLVNSDVIWVISEHTEIMHKYTNITPRCCSSSSVPQELQIQKKCKIKKVMKKGTNNPYFLKSCCIFSHLLNIFFSLLLPLSLTVVVADSDIWKRQEDKEKIEHHSLIKMKKKSSINPSNRPYMNITQIKFWSLLLCWLAAEIS